MQTTNHPQIRVEIQRDGSQVIRFIKDNKYDSNTIEGRTGERAAAVLGNRYDSVMIVANRIRELNRGDAPKIERKYGHNTTALQEVEQGLVGYELFGKIITRRRSSAK